MNFEIQEGKIHFMWGVAFGELSEKEGYLYSIIDKGIDGELVQIELNCLIQDLRQHGELPGEFTKGLTELAENESPFLELTNHDYVSFIRWPERKSKEPVSGVVHEARLLIDSGDNAIGVAIDI